MRLIRNLVLLTAVSLMGVSSELIAAPYASNFTITGGGTTVNFILNQDADNLTYNINNTGPVAFGDFLKGPKSFTIASGDTFEVVAERTELGYTSAAGGTIANAGSGLAYTLPDAVGTLISNPTDLLTRFNSPRGISVNMNPNTANFGTVYVSNSAAGAVGGRTLTGDGLYAVRADQTDAFGYADAAQGTSVYGAAASANTPYKIFVANNGQVYVTGFGDGVSGVFQMPGDLSSVTTVLTGTTGPTSLPPGQNHGSVTSTYVTGSSAGSDLVVYTLDEDLSTLQVTGSGSGVDTNKLWQYTINGGSLPYSGMPTAVASPLIPGFSIINDVDRGADGKWYLAQNRAQPANATGLYVTDPSGTVLFDSRVASAAAFPAYSTKAGDFNHDGTMNAADYVIWRNQQGSAGPDADANGDTTVDDTDLNVWRGGNGLAGGAVEAGFIDVVNDVFSNIFGLAVSPDQKWLATMHNNNMIGITPLVSGIPDIANMLVLPTVNTTISARDIAFDAAGNIHFVSSGQGGYTVFAPGGTSTATTSWNGSAYAFNINITPGAGGFGSVPEPNTMFLALASLAMMGAIRRRR